jgi:hypothetical protein
MSDTVPAHRTKPWVLGLIGLVTALEAQSFHGAVAGTLDRARKMACGSKANLLEPYVPDPQTAKAIFLAVEAARVPQADKRQFPLVDVMEKPGRWVVVRHSASAVGGGQLELEISKCTGTIYRAGFGK